MHTEGTKTPEMLHRGNPDSFELFRWDLDGTLVAHEFYRNGVRVQEGDDQPGEPGRPPPERETGCRFGPQTL